MFLRTAKAAITLQHPISNGEHSVSDQIMSMATFELYEDTAGQYRWRLVHDNGNIIADSGEGYASKQKARQGIDSVKDNAADADVVEE